MEKLSIGTMAKLNNLSEQTLRLYDKLDLFKPLYKDPNSGYRYYNIRQCAHLDLIQYMKTLDMELKDIKAIFDQQDVAAIKRSLTNRYDYIDGEIQNLFLQQKSLTQIISNIQQYEDAPEDGVIFLEKIQARKAFFMETSIAYTDDGTEVFENELRKLRSLMREQELPFLYSLNAGSFIPQEDFEARNFETSTIFSFVDTTLDLPSPNIRTLSPAYYLCMYCRNYTAESVLLTYMDKLLTYVEEKNYRVAGDYLCEIITDFPFDQQQGNGMFLKLQLPISFK